ncbi:MAG: glycosyltransferase family 39 protein [Deltaproteobacteria bacterium]|nr:glycosyltransferase family 39 protein [Deltaproteobacteria bacterium]
MGDEKVEGEDAEAKAHAGADAEAPAEADAGADAGAGGDAGAPAEGDADADAEEDLAPTPLPDDGPAWIPLAATIAVPLLFFFVLPPLTRAGLWDPHELNVADLARRIALNLHGATSLALEGADNQLPGLDDLGRPQLPFTSIALGFKMFGLHEWAGRLPLAIWGLLGVLTTYGFVARLVDRRAGVFAALALVTMPLYFVQARTMLGDIVTMSTFAMAFGGLTVAVFDRRDGGAPSTSARAAWLAIAIVGLVAGFYTRGGLVSVGAPAIAVGVAYALSLLNPQRRHDVLAHAVGALALVVGVYAAHKAFVGMSGRPTSLDPWVGAMVRPPAKYPTFDFMLAHVAAAMVPWSAFAPFALARMFIAPSGKAMSSEAFVRESETRLTLFVGAGIAFAAHGWMASRTDLVAFAGPAVVAATCGIALRDYERGAHPSVAVGVGTGVLLGLFHHELHKLPEKAFQAFAVMTAVFPESFKAHSLAIWWVVLAGFALVFFLTFVERDAKRTPFDPKAYLKVLVALRDAWDGMLALAYFAMVAGASLAGLAVWIGSRQHARWLPTLSSQMRDAVLNAWWATAFTPILVIFGLYFWCDVWLWTFGRSRPFSRSSFSRGFEPFEELATSIKEGQPGARIPQLVMGKLVVTPEKLEEGIGPTALLLLGPLMYLQVPGVVFGGLVLSGMRWPIALAFAIPSGVALFLALGAVGDLLKGSRAAFLVVWGVVVGGILCFSYYPALANQLSPKEVFESYQRVHKEGEPLALFGVGGRTAAYYAGGQPLILKDTNAAYEWLMAGEPRERRFLAVRTEELARLNRTYRERTASGKNLPVLDARSSQILLVASSLHGEKNENPLEKIVLTEPPKPQRKLDVNMEDKLEVLGYDILDVNHRLVDHVAPGKKYHMKTYYKVLAPVQTEWEAFIHIDGFHRRHNGDHKPCEGKYPMSLWLKDDVIVDDHEFTLEPNFSPGPYTLYFGLFIGETRLKVKSGPTDGENRVNGGALRVQ